jgi:hypothetical protein
MFIVSHSMERTYREVTVAYTKLFYWRWDAETGENYEKRQ